jgi:hypothetical protein
MSFVEHSAQGKVIVNTRQETLYLNTVSFKKNPCAINTFTAKVDHDRFKYLRFKLPESTLVDLKFTLLFCLK